MLAWLADITLVIIGSGIICAVIFLTIYLLTCFAGLEFYNIFTEPLGRLGIGMWGVSTAAVSFFALN